MNVQPQNQSIDLAREAAFALGAVVVRPATREVVAGEATDFLEPRVMQVLVVLAHRRGEVVSRDELILSCWGGRAVGDDAINRCIARIRRLAESHGGFSLETIPRVGYRLNETAPNETASAAAAPPDIARPDTGRFLMRHRGLLAGALMLAAGLVVGLAFLVLPAGKAPQKAARLPSNLTIAVLPFTPLYADPGGQRLGDSIASRIADMLVGTAFEVVSPARALQYRGSAKASAAQALKADFLIDGDIRREGDILRVAVRIIDGRSNTTVIAGTFERPVAEADSLPDEIVIKMSCLSVIPRRSTGWDTRVIAAFFRATYLSGVRNDFVGAHEVAEEAARIAPNDAFAQALHGLMAAYLAAVLPPERKLAMIAEARAAADQAIHLDPGYGDSQAVLGLIAPAFDWGTRENHFRQGQSADAQAAEIKLIDLLQNAGRFRESGPLADNLMTQGRSQIYALISVINARLWQSEPVRALIKGPGERTRYWTIPWFAAKLFEETFQGTAGDAEVMMREPGMRSLLDQDGRPTFSRIALALHYRRPADIKAAADDCARPDGLGPEAKRTCFIALVVLGQLDEAFRLADHFYPDQRGAMQEAREMRPGFVIPPAYLSVPQTAPLRADPRFYDVALRIGLLSYWKASHHPPDFCATEKAPVCALLQS